AFATDAGQVAFDGDGANGLYTEELLKHLRAPGLTIEQVFKRTRAGVLERSGGAQIPAEYSRLIGDDIYLAGEGLTTPVIASTPAAAVDALTEAMNRAVKAKPLEPPTVAEINRLAAAAKAEECLEALHARAESEGTGDYAAVPLASLLEQVKDTLKDVPGPAPKVVKAAEICEGVIRALRDCLPKDHALAKQLEAKAHNRRGDALLLLGKAEEALVAYEAALPLAPEDSYILYNRGRARLALGLKEEARADFTAVLNPKFNQPKARKLAEEALAGVR
ncbi:MAG TPA: caspase family protein, partial [Prosthecobacter sp.]|nr:caspase family protein [Prosthecobacter sp.]